MTLPWGRRYLMCPPEHFGILYEINPWMHREVVVDLDQARSEWSALVDTLEALGAEVAVLEPHPDLPDLVFTANAGIVNGDQFVPSRFRHPERRAESGHDADWFQAHGFRVDELSEDVCQEGAGDGLPFGGVLVCGYRFRSDASSHHQLSLLTGAAVRSVELVDPRLYHLDLTFCPLDDRQALVVPDAWDAYGRRVMEALVPEPLVLTLDEALTFCANSVVVGDAVVMHECPPALGRRLEARGFTVVESPVTEFLKAGGSCRCLTLAIDVVL